MRASKAAPCNLFGSLSRTFVSKSRNEHAYISVSASLISIGDNINNRW